MKKLVLIFLLILVPAFARAADTTLERPHWSLELKAGKFVPALSNFAQFYGKRDMPEYGIALAYKPIRQIDAGFEGSYTNASGTAFAPQHGTLTGRATYDLYPLSAFVLLRGIFSESQWVVPYAGGGWTRILYRQKVEHQETVKGSADGYHLRAGLQLLLDGMDPVAANNLFMEYGIFHTYLFVEARQTHAVVRSAGVNLGGTSYLAGLLFEF